MKRIAPGSLAAKAIAGFDGEGHYLIQADSEGRLLVRPYVVDPETLELVPQQQGGSGSSGGDVAVTNWPSSVPVTGEFYPDTQPVSGDVGSVPYSLRVDDALDPVLYIGEAQAGSADNSSVWRIKKVDMTHGVVTQWASAAGFVNRWDQRLSLSYS
jgi:hypothetical protein